MAALARIGGLAELKSTLYEQVYLALCQPDLVARYGITTSPDLLLYGAPGVGKTEIARGLAEAAGLHFRYVATAELLSKWIGQTESTLRHIFEDAEANQPAIIFFDELDVLGVSRDQLEAGESGYVQQLLTLMDGIHQRRGVAVIGATNRIEAIDRALVRSGRFQMLEVPLPSRGDRADILGIHLAEVPTADGTCLDSLAQQTEGVSGADLKRLCEVAARAAMKREISTGEKQEVCQTDLVRALAKARPSRQPAGRS